MKSKMRSLLILSIAMSPVWGSFSGCSQSDNPTPVQAPPPPAPEPAELKVPKTATGKTYGAGERYKKAMNKGQ
jgi:hypothetical protein